MSRRPFVKWAQRSDKLFITVELPNAKNVELKLESTGEFSFRATSGADGMPYQIAFDLYDKVDVHESQPSFRSRNVVYVVKKAESKWWSRLLKQEGKTPVFLKVDWDKWIDEEDEEPGVDMDFSDIDFSKLILGRGEDSDEEASTVVEDDESYTDNENENDPNATAEAAFVPET